ncbi:hypothetical protein VULLAG_LOCUS5847 [Vulpes lagopus]
MPLGRALAPWKKVQGSEERARNLHGPAVLQPHENDRPGGHLLPAPSVMMYQPGHPTPREDELLSPEPRHAGDARSGAGLSQPL